MNLVDPLNVVNVRDTADDKYVDDRLESTIASIPPKKTYRQQLALWGNGNRNASFWLSLGREFTYLAYPAVIWTILAYGTSVVLLVQVSKLRVANVGVFIGTG